MKYKQSSLVLALLLAIIPLYESSAASIDDLLGRTYLEVSPRFTYGLEYDDNLGYDVNGESRASDWGNRYRPSIMVDALSPQFSLKAEAELDIREYIKEKDFNSVDQNYQLALGYRPNERWEYSLGTGYLVDVSTNRYQDGLVLGDPFETDRYKEKTRDYFGGFSYLMTPRSSISLTGTFSNYDSGSTNDSNFYGAIAEYTYSLGTRTNLLVTGNYFYYDFNGNGQQNQDGSEFFYADYDYTLKNRSFLIGFEHTFLSGYELTVKGGFRQSKNKSTRDTGDPAPDDKEKASGRGDGWSGVLELVKSYNDFSFRFSGSQDITVSPQGSNYEATDLNLRTTYRINRRCDANLLLRWFRAYASGSSDEFLDSRDTHTYLIYSYVNYDLYRWLRVTVGHYLSMTESKRGNENTYHRNRVYINFTFIPLRKLVLR